MDSMPISSWRAALSGKAPLSVRKDDCYETPAVATNALMAVETLPEIIWEPACGPGAIVEVLRTMGKTVIATDLVDYGCENSIARRDFLMEQSAPDGCEAIVTNPPFKLASEFVRHGLLLVPKVVLLLRLAFLEGTGRSDVIDGGKFARVHVFRNRLPRMHRRGWEGAEATNTMAFAWFVWDRAHNGPTEMHRISWVPA